MPVLLTAAPGGAHRGFLLIAALLILIEFLWHRQRGSDGYDLRETAASTAMLLGQIVARLLTAIAISPLLLWIYQHRLFDLQMNRPLTLLGLFLCTEFMYYWFHRASHTIRWMWVSHGVHHSSTHLNLSAAYRLGWTNMLSGGWLFFAPLIGLGFAPQAVFGMLSANLLFQFLLHTEAVARLGPLEWIFNTPSQHRVHHTTDAQLLDRNFGGVLMVFDHLFGTHAEEPRDRALHYGLIGTAPSYNPFRIALGGWRDLLADLSRARSVGALWRTAFGRP